MKILCIGQVENDTFIREQIAKQTVQPTWVELYVDDEPASGIQERRKRITFNHHKLIQIVDKYPDADYIWQVEGDSELPEYTLELLIAGMNEKMSPKFGYISGIQVGRHGLYCLGAWKIDKDHKAFSSIDYRKSKIQKVDATGWYCLLAPKRVWQKGIASWTGQTWGPDVNWGLSLKRYDIYVDMDLHIGHKIKSGIIRPSDASTCNARFFYNGTSWVYKQTD